VYTYIHANTLQHKTTNGISKMFCTFYMSII